jgi:hypothetical protein
MDTTTRIIQQKKINIDTNTGLDRYAQVTCVKIDGENNGLITVGGRVVLLSPTAKTMFVESKWSFERYDKAAVFTDVKVIDDPETYYVQGEDMGNGYIATGGELKTAETFHYEAQQVTPANNKYTELEQSPIGQGIKQMLEGDLLGAIVNDVWTPANLNML